MSNETEHDFLPRNESARHWVLKSREIVKKNNEYIQSIKTESNIPVDQEEDPWRDAEFFSHDGPNSFDLYKIKSKKNVVEFIKDIFGM
jgi:hypothetical protein